MMTLSSTSPCTVTVLSRSSSTSTRQQVGAATHTATHFVNACPLYPSPIPKNSILIGLKAPWCHSPNPKGVIAYSKGQSNLV